MTDHVSAQAADGLIKLPEMKRELQISDEWLGGRDGYLERVKEIEGNGHLSTNQDFQAASKLLKSITKHSNALESVRKDYAKPFTQAAKLIKQVSDVARDPLEKAKGVLSKIIGDYAAEQRRIEREERAKAEQAAREEAERKLSEQSDDDMFSDPDEEITVETEAVSRRAVSNNIRVIQKVHISFIDEERVPRAFCSVDQRKINQYIRDNNAELKAALAEKDEGGTIEPIEGVTLILETKPVST